MLQPTFSTPTEHRFLVLMRGALLTMGRQTITNIVRTVHPYAKGHISSYHRVFSPRRGSAWGLARLLRRVLLDHGVPPGPVLLEGDNTVADRPGPHVFGQGGYRDRVRSPHRDTAYRWGHTWGVVSILVTWPCAVRPWALPGWVAWSRAPAWDQAHGRRHRTPAHLARLLWARVVRGFPARQCIVVGETGAGTSETARFGRKQRAHLTWVGQLSGAAAWYEAPPPRPRHTMGRPRLKGQKLASPPEVVASTAEPTHLTVAWYGGSTRDLEVVTGTGHWYRMGETLVDVRWVYVHDGPGTHRDESCLTTDITMRPQPIVDCDTQRWSSETTVQVCREDLTRASPKGDGPQTVVRFTPGWVGLYTVIMLLSLQLPRPSRTLRTVCGRGQSTLTCSAMLTGVRRALWEPWCVHTQADSPELATLSPSLQERMLYARAPAA
jgi:hypothetical protein